MLNKQQLIALYTLIRREWFRMFKLSKQILFPPIITTALYFLIFGTIIGERIGTVQHVNYIQFLTPGLIIMSVITNAYSNVSTSIFALRFQKSIEELLVSPMHNSLLLLGFTLSGVLRGITIATLLYFVSCLFISIHIQHWGLSLTFIILVSTLFSLAGFINGTLAHDFEDIAIVPTFILTPLSYLGGIFYSTSMLPLAWQHIMYLNPIFYMVSAFRYAMIGTQDVSPLLSIAIIGSMIVILTVVCMYFLKKGVGLRE